MLYTPSPHISPVVRHGSSSVLAFRHGSSMIHSVSGAAAWSIASQHDPGASGGAPSQASSIWAISKPRRKKGLKRQPGLVTRNLEASSALRWNNLELRRPLKAYKCYISVTSLTARSCLGNYVNGRFNGRYMLFTVRCAPLFGAHFCPMFGEVILTCS